MLPVRLCIAAGALALVCGQLLIWRRRDNVIGYLQVGTFLSTIAVPLFGTEIVRTYEDDVVNVYALVIALGAPAFLLGLSYGAYVGRRSADRLPLTFARSFASSGATALVWRRARWIAVVALTAMAAAYVLIGYIPLLAADTRAAKYGIGAYAEGFVRGRIVYLFSLILAAGVLPVMLALFRRHRRPVDLVLAAGLEIGLLCSLNRGLAFLGPVTFLVALAVERRVRPPVILAGVVVAFFGGILFNQVTLSGTSDRSSFAALAAASAPDVADHLNFLRGYEANGRQENRGRTILTGLDPRGGEDGSSYALRTATGISDVSLLASGGLRLPAPVWGYSAFGLWGAVLWSFVSGLFAGWGAAKFKRLLQPAMNSDGQSLNLVLAVLVYNGSFGLLEQFYFTSTAGFVLLGLALVLGIHLRVPVRAGATSPAAPADRDRAAGRRRAAGSLPAVDGNAARS